MEKTHLSIKKKRIVIYFYNGKVHSSSDESTTITCINMGPWPRKKANFGRYIQDDILRSFKGTPELGLSTWGFKGSKFSLS